MNPVSDQAPDFRSRRALLPKEAFAQAVGPQSRPTDLITPETWSSIIALPDHVSIRTTNHFGSLVKDLWWCWGEWTALVLALGAAGEVAHQVHAPRSPAPDSYKLECRPRYRSR